MRFTLSGTLIKKDDGRIHFRQYGMYVSAKIEEGHVLPNMKEGNEYIFSGTVHSYRSVIYLVVDEVKENHKREFYNRVESFCVLPSYVELAVNYVDNIPVITRRGGLRNNSETLGTYNYFGKIIYDYAGNLLVKIDSLE